MDTLYCRRFLPECGRYDYINGTTFRHNDTFLAKLVIWVIISNNLEMSSIMTFLQGVNSCVTRYLSLQRYALPKSQIPQIRRSQPVFLQFLKLGELTSLHPHTVMYSGC